MSAMGNFRGKQKIVEHYTRKVPKLNDFRVKVSKMVRFSTPFLGYTKTVKFSKIRVFFRQLIRL
ncbi:hypothetical protein ACKLNO_04765 [Neisseriaceae bacterium B1]